ncbi:MAG: hypothetical protein Homavirus28_1, partial [Homavirus sp.]
MDNNTDNPEYINLFDIPKVYDDTNYIQDNFSLIYQIQNVTCVDNSRLSVDNSRLSVDNSRLSVDNSRLSVDNSRLSVDNSRLSIDNSRLSVDNHFPPADTADTVDSKNYACIMEVGKITNTGDIMINKFDLNKKIRCIMVSTIYNKEQLIEASNTCRFNMIKIIINYNDGQKLIPICYMTLNFNFFDHIKEKKSIINYISTKNSIIKLNGIYYISLHYTDNISRKYVRLKNFETYLGH